MISLKHRFDTKADNCNPAIEHKGASETHRWKTLNCMIDLTLTTPSPPTVSSVLIPKCIYFFMSWARHTAKAKARGRSPAKHTTASRWSLKPTTTWKPILQSDSLVCERFPGTAARWLERLSTVLSEWLWRLGNHRSDCGSGGRAESPMTPKIGGSNPAPIPVLTHNVKHVNDRSDK